MDRDRAQLIAISAASSYYSSFTNGDTGLAFNRFEIYIRLPEDVRHAVDETVLQKQKARANVEYLRMRNGKTQYFVYSEDRLLYPSELSAEVWNEVVTRAQIKASPPPLRKSLNLQNLPVWLVALFVAATGILICLEPESLGDNGLAFGIAFIFLALVGAAMPIFGDRSNSRYVRRAMQTLTPKTC